MLQHTKHPCVFVWGGARHFLHAPILTPVLRCPGKCRSNMVPDVRCPLHAGAKVGTNTPLETVTKGSSSSTGPVDVDLTG